MTPEQRLALARSPEARTMRMGALFGERVTAIPDDCLIIIDQVLYPHLQPEAAA